MTRNVILRQAILVSLAALIPIPFLDTWIQGRLRAEMTRALAHQHHVSLDPPSVHLLSDVQSSMLLGCLLGVVWWPIKKLIRKVIYVFTIKDALDVLADTFTRGLLLEEALSQGLLPAHGERVRAAMDEALRGHIRSPLWGPKTTPEQVQPMPDDTLVLRLVAWTARRGGASGALDTFRQLLAEPA